MLFEKSTIAGVELKNKLIRSATHDGLALENGAPSDELIRKYENLAGNEVGMIITGYAAVSRNGVSPYPKMLKIYDDCVIDDYRTLTDRVHAYGTPIVLQLAHCGRQTSSKAIGCQKVAPSSVMHLFYPDKAKEMSESDILSLVDDFVDGAKRAEKAGFDGVELHGGHGYILHDFLSSYGNRRKDRWGGSLENRCRVVEMIISGIKENTSLPVFIKISAEDNRKGGMNIEDTCEILKRLEKAGLDAVEVSCGTVEDGMNTMRSELLPMEAVFHYREPVASFPNILKKVSLPFANLINPLIKQPSPLENFNVENAYRIRNSVSIPVIVVGGIHKKSDMEAILTEGKADYISMCRPFICEPNLAKKLREGTADEAKCIMCNYCGLVIEKGKTKCLYGKL